ncbi:hypothetical protein ACFVJ5_08955 [Nocardia sp. NPDC127606]|uniref:hypothetical protein n=1 Tax=Nocardia sp. NPDC127606 TaxID=3345406 RepID=UPI0036373E26
MTDTVTRSINHAQFTIEREVPVAPAVVFQAFADPAVTAKWFGGEEGWEQGESSIAKLTLVEFGAHLDGFDTGAQREEGTLGLVDALVAYLVGQA